jgi:homoserine kinase
VPIAIVPETTVSTAAARNSLPDSVPHADAAFTAGRAALLGVAVAQRSPELFAAAIHDRLHEPYRSAKAPLLEDVRAELPEGALGATLSGSGPTVIVWVREESAAASEAELASKFTEASVVRFAVSPEGASAL